MLSIKETTSVGTIKELERKIIKLNAQVREQKATQEDTAGRMVAAETEAKRCKLEYQKISAKISAY